MTRYIRGVLAAMLAALILTVGAHAGAAAAEAPPPTTTVTAVDVSNGDVLVVDDQSPVIHLDQAFLVLVVGSVMPFLTSLLTKSGASSKLKGVLNLVLSVVGGIAAAFLSAGDAGLTTYQILTAGFAAYAAGQILYTGVWRPTGATAALNNATSTFGLGTQ